MPQENNTLSIIVPIFNEFNLIEDFISNLKDAFENTKCKYIFIDDGSTDGTREWLSKNLENFFLTSKYEFIKLNKNYGKAYAVKAGINHIEGDFTLLIDSDLEYDPVDARELFEIAKKIN